MPEQSPVETVQENGSMYHKALSCSDMGYSRTSGEGQRTAILHPLVLSPSGYHANVHLVWYVTCNMLYIL